MNIQEIELAPIEAGRLVIANKAAFAAQIAELTDHYSVLVTDKAEAKRDRAAVNKILKNIDDKRKEAKRQYEAPFKAFEAELKELTEPLKDASASIDAQIKVLEEEERKERRAWIEEEYSKFPTDVSLSEVWDEAWLNLSKSKASILSELTMAIMMAQAKPKDATPIDAIPTGYNGNGVPVFNFDEAREHKLTIFATTAQMQNIERLLVQMGVFYMEA